jgi:hypothetical protein
LGLISRWRNIVFWMYLSPIALMSDASSGRTDIVLGPWLDISNTHLCQGYGPNAACQHTIRRGYGLTARRATGRTTSRLYNKPRSKAAQQAERTPRNKPREQAAQQAAQSFATSRQHTPAQTPHVPVVDPKDIAPIFRLPKLHVSQPRC